MAGMGKSGVRIGNWFLWLDAEVADLSNDSVPIITARKAITGGDILAREILTREHVSGLRQAAAAAEKLLDAAEGIAKPDYGDGYGDGSGDGYGDGYGKASK